MDRVANIIKIKHDEIYIRSTTKQLKCDRRIMIPKKNGRIQQWKW